MAYVKGTLLGLGLFAAWIGAIAGIILVALYWQYWIWAVFPAAFIAFGIRLMLDKSEVQSVERLDTPEDMEDRERMLDEVERRHYEREGAKLRR